MRFKAINLLAFGPFTDHRLVFSKNPDFHLIYGPNEAGKSSALRGLISALYGIHPRTPDDFQHPYAKLQVSVELEKKQERLNVTRRKRNIDSLLDTNSQQPIDEKVLQSFLGNVNQQVFENLFGLDHHRLREGGRGLLADQGDLGFSIFSAATGINHLQAIVARLDETSKALFVPQKNGRGSLNQIIRDFKVANDEAASLTLRGRDWQKLETDYKSKQQAIQKINQHLGELEKQLSQYKRIKRVAPLVNEAEELRKQLAILGDVEIISAEASAARESAEAEIAQGERDYRRGTEKMALLEKDIAKLVIPEQVLTLGEDIRELVEQVAIYRDKIKDSSDLKEEISQLKRETLITLQTINHQEKTLDNVDYYLIPLLVRTTLRQLLSKRENLAEKLESASQELKESQQELAVLNADIKRIKQIPHNAKLKKTIGLVQQDIKLEQELTENKLEQDRLLAEINADITQLGLWQGSASELAALEVPDSVVAQEYHEKMQTYNSELKYLADQIEEHENRLHDTKLDLLDLDSQGTVPTLAQLKQARDIRQQGWELVKLAWLDADLTLERELEFTNGAPLAEAYEAKVAVVDQIADSMYDKAQNVGRKQTLLNGVKQIEHRLTTLQERKQELTVKIKTLLNNWQVLWQETGIESLAPDKMLPWLENRLEILVKFANLERLILKSESLLATKEQHLKSLTDAIKAVDRNVSVALESSLNATLNMAITINEEIEKQIHQLHALESSQTTLLNRIRRQAEIVAEHQKDIAELDSELEANLDKTNLPRDVKHSVLTVYLDSIDELSKLLVKQDEKTALLKQEQEFIANYEAQVANLVQESAPDLVSERADLAIQALNLRLQEGEKARVTQEQLLIRLQNEEEIVAEAKAEIAAAEHVIKQLLTQAGVPDLAALKKEEQRCVTYLEIVGRLKEIEKQLLAEGRSLDDLAQEVVATDLDSLDLMISETEVERERYQSEKEESLTEFGKIEAKYHAVHLGTNDSALQSREEAEGLLASLQDQAKEYMRLKAASVMLGKAIDHYRQQNQGPILEFAEVIFARLTAGSFSSLKVDSDLKGQPIIFGVRESGQEVGVEGMSDGTLDQLYLALRLGAIENHLKTNDPMPLICDDLLVNFDDQRSLNALETLADLACQTQVIFFTHHGKILELAQDHLADRVQIHYLNKEYHLVQSQ